MAAQSCLRLSLFGSLYLEGDLQPLDLATAKSKSLLAFLVLHPEPHPREKLAAMFWGDATDSQALHSLRTALTTIHKTLGDIFLADRETVQLNPDYPLEVDVLEFQKCVVSDPASAIPLYRGDLLVEFYDDWILPERERLRALYLDALLRLVQQHRAKSEYAQAIELAQRVLASDPANEIAHQHLMFCHLASGDRSAALAQYEKCVQALERDLNVAPSAETQALYEQIKSAPSESGAARITNLPIPLTSFVGREKEIEDIKELVNHTRLLTLTGAGGCGKTRLAIQAARELSNANRFEHGIWYVELAPLANAALVPQTVFSALGPSEGRDVSVVAQLSKYLGAKSILLVLDNCEHLIDACAQLAEHLLTHCPNLRMLATSRERLNIEGESIYPVPTLAVPDPMHLPMLDALGHYDAVHLFVERAAAVQAHFVVTDATAPAVAQICYHLDGIPLAIELAAARLRLLAPAQIAAHLEDRFRLLTGGSRTALPRQQTLRATMDWTYGLLSEAERVLLQRFSVFAGGWTLDAAENVCSGKGIAKNDVLDLLTGLVDKSVVIVTESRAERRYRLLETVRQYASEKLAASNEADRIRDRHLDYYLGLGEQARPDLVIGDPDRLERVETDFDNFRAALEHVMVRDIGLAVRLAVSLEWFWAFRYGAAEAHTWGMRLADATANCQPGRLRFTALRFAGAAACDVGKYESSRLLLEAALEMARSLGDKYGVLQVVYDLAVWNYHNENWKGLRAYATEELALAQELGDNWAASAALWQLGAAASGEEDYAAARSHFAQSLEIARRSKSPNQIAFCLSSLADLARADGDYAGAEKMYEECIHIRRQMRHRGPLGSSLAKLGQVALHEGNPARARALFEESLALWRELELVEVQVDAVCGFAGAAGIEHRCMQAAKLFGAAEALSKAVNWPMRPLAHLVYDPIVSAVRERLGESTFNATWGEGRAMSLEQAIELALRKES